jgi:hypothetical protein
MGCSARDDDDDDDDDNNNNRILECEFVYSDIHLPTLREKYKSPNSTLTVR